MPSSSHKSQSPRLLTWNDVALTAINATQEALANGTLLCYHSLTPTYLTTDASDNAVGAVLQQFIDGTYNPISFFSRKMDPTKTHSSTFDGELLAVYLAIRHFYHFLEG